jgi:hypothetical protein
LVTAEAENLRGLLERRARIQSPALESGWHEGVFNRQRREPPCFLVLIVEPRQSSDSSLRVRATVQLRDVSRLEVYAGPVSSMTEWAGRQSANVAGDSLWRSVPPDVVDANRNCPP